ICFYQVRVFLTTGTAPARPKVDKDILPSKIVQRNRLSFGVVLRKIRSDFAYCKFVIIIDNFLYFLPIIANLYLFIQCRELLFYILFAAYSIPRKYPCCCY